MGSGDGELRQPRLRAGRPVNLTLLKKHKVHLALGSDSYRFDTLPDAEYLHGLGVFENRDLLQMWSENTARTIFPKRKIGRAARGL